MKYLEIINNVQREATGMDKVINLYRVIALLGDETTAAVFANEIEANIIKETLIHKKEKLLQQVVYFFTKEIFLNVHVINYKYKKFY